MSTIGRRLCALFRTNPRRRQSTGKNRVRPDIQALEDRAVPTLFFPPQLGPESTCIPLNGPRLSSQDVMLVFWGPSNYWTRDLMSQTTVAVNHLLDSPYLSGLNPQYQSDGKALLVDEYPDQNPLPSQMNELEVQGQMALLHDTGQLDTQLPSTIYVFMTPYWVQTDDGFRYGGGANFVNRVTPLIGDDTPLIWDAGGFYGTVDDYTFLLSHEIAECMSSPGDKGVLVHPGIEYVGPEPSTGQIGDYEPNRYSVRMSDGVLVQPYWSMTDSGFIVPDGTPSKQFYIEPIYKASHSGQDQGFTGQYDVVVMGDAGGPRDDQFTVGTFNSPSGTGVSVTANGETALFDPGQVHYLILQGGGGENTVTLNGLPSDVTLFLTSAGSNDVAGDLTVNYTGKSTVAGTVYATVDGGGLTVADQTTPAPQSITVTPRTVTVEGNTPLNYMFDTSPKNHMEVDGGGDCTFTIEDTPAGIPLPVGAYFGGDTVFEQGRSGPVTVLDEMDLEGTGVFVIPGRTGLLLANSEPLSLQGKARLVLDDSADTQNQPITITGQAVTYGPPNAPLTKISFTAMEELTVDAGPGIQSITIDGATFPTVINASAPNGTVTVNPNSETVAGTNLTVHGSGSTSLTVHDEANGYWAPLFTTQYTLNRSQLSTTEVYPWSKSPVPNAVVNFDGLQNLQVDLGNNTSNQVSVEGGAPATTIQAGAGSNTINLSPSSQDLDWTWNSTLTVQGAGSTTLNIDDQANTHAATSGSANGYMIGPTGLSRSVVVTGHRGPVNETSQIDYIGLTQLNFWAAHSTNHIVLVAGAGQPSYSTVACPDTVHAGTPKDRITILPTDPYGTAAPRHVTVDGDGGTLILDDTSSPPTDHSDPTDMITDTVTLMVTDQTVSCYNRYQEKQVVEPPDGSHQPPKRHFLGSDDKTYSVVSYGNVGGVIIQGGPADTTYAVQSTPSGIPVTILAGASGKQQFQIGDAGSVKGIRSLLTLTGPASGAATLAVNDSRSTSPDQVTVTPDAVGAAPKGLFFGHGGGLRYSRLGALTIDLSNAPGDTVRVTPSPATTFTLNGSPTQYQAGHGAQLALDLTGVKDPVDWPQGPGSGYWIFANRARVTYSGMSPLISLVPTTTTLSSSAGVAVYGQMVTFTIKVSDDLLGGGIPTGTVTLRDRGTVLSTVSLIAGSAQATFAARALGGGMHSITATYNGDAYHRPSTSAIVTLRIIDPAPPPGARADPGARSPPGAVVLDRLDGPGPCGHRPRLGECSQPRRGPSESFGLHPRRLRLDRHRAPRSVRAGVADYREAQPRSAHGLGGRHDGSRTWGTDAWRASRVPAGTLAPAAGLGGIRQPGRRNGRATLGGALMIRRNTKGRI
jgi:hypothetical protein